MDKQKSKSPLVRFPEFEEGWEHKQLNELLTVSKKKNKDLKYSKEEVLSVSGELGIVNQIEHLGRSYAGASVHNYGVVEVGDIVYTKSPLKANPYGIIKLNKYKAGIVSTLYAVYTVNQKADGEFIEYYFSLDANLNRYLRPLVRKGAKNDMKISNEYVLNDRIYVPQLEEQKRIAYFFNVVDKKLNQLEGKLNGLEDYKKGMTQQIFSQNLRFKDENGQYFPNWETQKLKDIGKFKAGGDLTKLEYSKVIDNNYPYPIYANGAGESIYGYSKSFQYSKGCVTVSGRGYLGYAKMRTEKFCAIVRLIVIKPNDNINPKFLEASINNIKFAIESTGVPQLTVPQIKTYKLNIPCLDEQNKISLFLSRIDDKINTANKQIETVKNYKKALLQKMFCN